MKTDKESSKKLKSEIKQLKKSLKKVNLSKLKDKDILKEVNSRGYFTVKKELPQDVEYDLPEETATFKIGVVSDTHIGSIYQQLTHLKHFYKECKKEGITKIFHAGDLVEGNGKLYRGQSFEMFLNGSANQLKYLIKNYPKVKGITTYIIGGNHCYSFYKESGYDIIEAFAEARKDVVYLGFFGTTINIEKITLYLMHGAGGGAYARSYKMQKILEQFSPANKPNILLLGHYHSGCYLPMYRNVDGFQLHCFQAQTPYLKARGLSPEIGGLILTIVENVAGVAKVLVDYRRYYTPIENDY